MYDPTIGRWISQDPIGFAAGDANLYRYVGNRPASLLDPTGLAGTSSGPPVENKDFYWDKKDVKVGDGTVHLSWILWNQMGWTKVFALNQNNNKEYSTASITGNPRKFLLPMPGKWTVQSFIIGVGPKFAFGLQPKECAYFVQYAELQRLKSGKDGKYVVDNDEKQYPMHLDLHKPGSKEYLYSDEEPPDLLIARDWPGDEYHAIAFPHTTKLVLKQANAALENGGRRARSVNAPPRGRVGGSGCGRFMWGCKAVRGLVSGASRANGLATLVRR